MADIYDNAAALTQRQLQPRPAGKGAPFRLVQPGSGDPVYDPTTATYTNPAPVNHDGLGFRSSWSVREVDGSLIRADDVKFLVAPLKVNGAAMPEPKTTDTVTFEGSTYNVINCWPMDYAGKLVAYKVQGRIG